jgi:hypothetical protein
MGVKATPAWLPDNFTPVKKTPMTKSSIQTFWRELGAFLARISRVSAMTEHIYFLL